MTAKERVVAKYPDAVPIPRASGMLWDIMRRDGTVVGTALTGSMAWESASSRLPSESVGVQEVALAIPGDQKPMYLLRFDDTDMREMVFDRETDAWEAWHKYNSSWNCWLFGPMQVNPTPQQSGAGSTLTPTPAAGDGLPPLADWEDADVQRVYAILNDDLAHKPAEEHWEGYCARWIVGELIKPERAKMAALVEEVQGRRTQVDDLLEIYEEDAETIKALRAQLAEANKRLEVIL